MVWEAMGKTEGTVEFYDAHKKGSFQDDTYPENGSQIGIMLMILLRWTREEFG